MAREVREAVAAYGGRVVRWPANRPAPIRLWVQAAPAVVSGSAHIGPSPDPSAADWRWAVISGARAWDGVVPGLRFALTRDSAAAEVHVLWEQAGRDHPGRPRPGGFSDGTHGHTAVVASRTGVIEGADVTLGIGAGVRDGAAGALPVDVRAVAAHEFGHVLGLVHRAEPRSAMAPAVRANGVSARDQAVLQAWYDLPTGSPCR